MPSSLTISPQTQRRFILGKQGLYPGRRWQGKAGAAQAMREGVVVQIDPLCIISRSHDIALHSRVLDYTPGLLNDLLYQDRAFFDWGGVVRLYPMESLPYTRVVMARSGEQRAYLAEQNPGMVDEVLAMLRERGPLCNRDFASPPGERRYWHAAKSTAQVLYYLWLKGEVMTHSRRGFDRVYDLAERIVPPPCDRTASVDEAEHYFAVRVLQELGLADLRTWRSALMDALLRKISFAEAAERLDTLVAAGIFARVTLEENGSPVTAESQTRVKDSTRYLLAQDLPLLEALHAGRIPDIWQPLGPSTTEEAAFLAPLEIVSARGRALPVFGFEYVWEVYKPVAERRWGYYVLPILVGDRLVARFDSVFDKPRKCLGIKGFWAEAPLEDCQCAAITAGFQRFAQFLGAEQIEWGPGKDYIGEELPIRAE